MSDPQTRLAELRAAATKLSTDLATSFDDIVDAMTDVATDDEHDPEGHTIAWERQQVAALMEENKATLSMIEAAQQRLNDGRYGACTECGQKISPERLDALPAVPTCIDCAR